MRHLTWLLLSLLSLVTAKNFTSNVLGSHMVLQRAPLHAHLWGWSNTPGCTITVSFNQKIYTTKANIDDIGLWRVWLDPTPPGGPYTIEISSSVGEMATLEDVLFGDVYLCGGQSNMQFTVDSAANSTEEINAAAKYPHIRLFTVGTKSQSTTPLEELATILQPWTIASPTTVGLGNWTAFSAVCWFFGRDLYDHLQIPIGLFSNNYGGTTVETWTSPTGVKKCNKTTGPEISGPHDPSLLWNSMIVPVLRMSLVGVIWYQGESNSDNANYYACAFPEMITDWRNQWTGETPKNFAFFFVQIAPWFSSGGSGNPSEARIRLSQMFATKLPNVGYATAVDLGDPASPFGSIHPRFKQEVGRRLTLAARRLIYHELIQDKGPEASNFTVLTDGPDATVEVTFTPDSVASGLVEKPFPCPSTVPVAYCTGYEISYGTKITTWVTAKPELLNNNSIVLSATFPGSDKVTGVRYGWSEYPLMTLYNLEGLPAIPFAFPNPITPVQSIF